MFRIGEGKTVNLALSSKLGRLHSQPSLEKQKLWKGRQSDLEFELKQGIKRLHQLNKSRRISEKRLSENGFSRQSIDKVNHTTQPKHLVF